MVVGPKIRSLRKSLGISIKDVSEKTGLTSSLISQIERDQANPSLSTLKKISDTLGVSVIYFLQDDDKNFSAVVRRKQRKRIYYGDKYDIFHELLTPDLRNKKIEFLYNEWEPGASSDGFLVHEGEEYGLILGGKVEIKVGSTTYVLEEGDSIYFNSAIPHSFKNIGEVKLKMVWAITPPTF